MPCLHCAGGRDQGAVHVDGGQVEEVVGLLGPDAAVACRRRCRCSVSTSVAREAAAEVAGGGRVGDAAGAEGVEEVLVLAAQFDVLQAGAVAQGVVGEVEHVIGFVVGQVDLEQVQALVDGVDQADAPGEQMDGADAAVGDATRFGRHFVMNVAGREPRFEGDRIALLVEPAFDAALAIAEPAAENGLHLKSFCERGDGECRYFLKHRNHRRISGFFRQPTRNVERPSLVQGLRALH